METPQIKICENCALSGDHTMGQKPRVVCWEDAPGWGVICDDCGMEVDGKTRLEAIFNWNGLMQSKNAITRERIEPLIVFELDKIAKRFRVLIGLIIETGDPDIKRLAKELAGIAALIDRWVVNIGKSMEQEKHNENSNG